MSDDFRQTHEIYPALSESAKMFLASSEYAINEALKKLEETQAILDSLGFTDKRLEEIQSTPVAESTQIKVMKIFDECGLTAVINQLENLTEESLLHVQIKAENSEKPAEIKRRPSKAMQRLKLI